MSVMSTVSVYLRPGIQAWFQNILDVAIDFSETTEYFIIAWKFFFRSRFDFPEV